MKQNDYHSPHQTLTEEQFNLIKTVIHEYENGFMSLNTLGVPYTFTFYGGHKIQEEDPVYKLVTKIAEKLAQKGWGIVSGGGPGVMSAALEGAILGGGKSLSFGINIEGEKVNPGHRDISLMFTQFSVRKFMLRQSDAFAFAPGGFGTLDELMELLTLIKTHKYPQKPIFLLDSDFWKGYLDWFTEILLNERKVVNDDFLRTVKLVNNEDEVLQFFYDIQ